MNVKKHHFTASVVCLYCLSMLPTAQASTIDVPASVETSSHSLITSAPPLAEIDLHPAVDLPDSSALATAPTVPATVSGIESVPVQKIPDRYVTRDLLRLQASGDVSADLLPMMGAVSTAAYKRYLASFNHSIPEFFDTAVEDTP